jgi:hypothetical protein
MPRAKIILLILFQWIQISAHGDANAILAELEIETKRIEAEYFRLLSENDRALKQVDVLLKNAATDAQKIECLIEKDRLESRQRTIQIDSSNEISRIRYLKGLQIIKILYEKILSLDHHFASVRTLGEINRMANPTQYPEYAKLREVLNTRKDKKAFDLTSILGTNTIVSVVQTFTSLLGSNLSKEEKERELAAVECLLDFTLRMQNDLNTIYFETAYLQTCNEKIKTEIEFLFRDYGKPIGYFSSLENCRKVDDWESIPIKTEEYLVKMKSSSGTAHYRMQVNLEFPIDRLLLFISQYNAYIDQGGRFYEKFRIILNSYENEKACDSRLPAEYKKLKADIDVAVEKFNVAYKPVEVNGSKMKEILYGLE